MRRSLTMLTLLAAAGLAATAGVAGAQAVIDPGMTRAQVVERLGKPASERTRGDFTYLFYSNGCEKTCGTSDFVTLEKDQVVDAVFRHAGREYSGESSSPRSVSSVEAAASARRPAALRTRPARRANRPAPAVVGGLEVETSPVPSAVALTPAMSAPAAAPMKETGKEAAAVEVPAVAVPAAAAEPSLPPILSPAAVPAGSAPLIIRVGASARPDSVNRTP